MTTKREMQTKNCPIHGEYTYEVCYLNGKPLGANRLCPKCMEAKKAQHEEMERQHNLSAFKTQVQQSGIPKIFWGKGFKSFIPKCEKSKAVLESLKQYAAEFKGGMQGGDEFLFPVLVAPPSILFTGKNGTGKTHLACALGQELLFCGRAKSVQFLTAYDVSLKIKESWRGRDGEGESTVYSELLNPCLLIIDEVGVQYGSDAENLHFFHAFNKRYQEGKPTVLITNLTSEELPVLIGPRSYDRLRDGLVFGFDWASHRGRM